MLFEAFRPPKVGSSQAGDPRNLPKTRLFSNYEVSGGDIQNAVLKAALAAAAEPIPDSRAVGPNERLRRIGGKLDYKSLTHSFELPWSVYRLYH
jgi:hypothetical protein